MGYNYGTCLPAFGVVAMILFCMILGIIQGFLFLKTRSIWASVVFHAALNGIDLWAPSNLCMVGKANPFIGPDVTGIIGAMGLIVAAFLCLVWIYKNQRSPKTRAL